MAKRTDSELRKLRMNLLEQRRDILEKIHTKIEQGSVTVAPDENDAATYAAEEDLSLSLATMGSVTLHEIDLALKRIESGDYGNCDACGETINPERLKALPFATLCVKCKELEEKGLL